MSFNTFKKNVINTRIRKIFFLVFIILLILFSFFTFFYLFDKCNIGIPCIIKKTTGFECPGCGTTRAINSLIHLNINEALKYNALIFVTLPFLAYYFISSIYSWIFEKKMRQIPTIIIIFLTVVVIVYGILRNII